MIRVEFDSELDNRAGKINLDRIEYNGQSGKVDRGFAKQQKLYSKKMSVNRCLMEISLLPLQSNGEGLP